LTLIVSLEAIFLSTSVMIGQNRQASFPQAKADHDFAASELELHADTELTSCSPAHHRDPRPSCPAHHWRCGDGPGAASPSV
jgi:hypothetical protein